MSTLDDLRLVHELDEAQILQLHALYQGEWWTQGRELSDIRRMLASTDLLFAFCEEGSGSLAAFARVLTDGVYKAFLFDVIVHPDWRGSGLGRRLIDAVTEHPRLREVRHLELYCRPELVHFYEQWGFTVRNADVCLMRRDRPESAP